MPGPVLCSGYMIANKNVTVLALRALMVEDEQETEEGILGRGHGIHKGLWWDGEQASAEFSVWWLLTVQGGGGREAIFQPKPRENTGDLRHQVQFRALAPAKQESLL